MEKKTIELYRKKFDDIRHESDGIEYWYARELMKLLDYVQWRNFDNAVNKAMLSCENNGNLIENHFSKINSTIAVGKGARREVEDYMLTRYACYLIAENGDPRKEHLPTLTIAAKNLATEMTNYNVEEKDLQGEMAITDEHVENNTSVREMLGQRGIKPENLPASEDIKKLERRVKREEKKLAEQSGKCLLSDMI